MHHDVRDSGFVGVLAAVAIQVIPDEVADGASDVKRAAVGDLHAFVADHHAIRADVREGHIAHREAVISLTRYEHAVAVPRKLIIQVGEDLHPVREVDSDIRDDQESRGRCAEIRRVGQAHHLVGQRNLNQLRRYGHGAATEVRGDAFVADCCRNRQGVEARVGGLDIGTNQALVRLARQRVGEGARYPLAPLIGVGDPSKGYEIGFTDAEGIPRAKQECLAPGRHADQ